MKDLSFANKLVAYILASIVAAVIVLLGTYAFYLAYNMFATGVFNLPPLNYWTAFALTAFTSYFTAPNPNKVAEKTTKEKVMFVLKVVVRPWILLGLVALGLYLA